MRALLVVVGVLGATACTAVTADGVRTAPARHGLCATVVHGACLVEADPRYPVDAERLAAAFPLIGAYWGTGPDALHGYAVLFHGPMPVVFGDLAAWGLTQLQVRRMDIALQKPQCPELVLAHEWGHVAAGAGHDDPRYEEPALLYLLREVPGCSP